MYIVIFGGAFDPPHNGHSMVAQTLLTQKTIDQVWLMPVGSHPFDKSLSPAPARLAMLKYLETPDIIVSDFELKRGKKSYTIETLRALQQEYPAHTFSWCIGADTLSEFTKWKAWQALLQEHQLIIFPRGTAVDLRAVVMGLVSCKDMPENIRLIEDLSLPRSAISSSMVRACIRDGKDISRLVPEGVARYIYEQKLYIKSS